MLRPDERSKDGAGALLPAAVRLAAGPAPPADWPNIAYSSFVHAGNVRWHVQRAGEGPVLLLMHGAGASSHSWRDMLLPLAGHFDVIAFDLPGHAFSGPLVPPAVAIGDYARAVAALLREMNLSVALVAGHSAGAALACEMALAGLIAPKEIVSLNGAFFPPFGFAGRMLAPFTRRLAASRTVVRHLTSHLTASRENITRLIESTGSTLAQEGVERYVQLAQLPNHVNGVLSMMAAWDLTALLRKLPRLAIPLQLLCGARDRMVPVAQARRLKPSIRGAELTIFEGLGHLAHEEQPALFVEFLRQRRDALIGTTPMQSP